MKKIMIYALAACATWLAGCSKDAGIDQQVAGDGKYTLPAITASLDDAETRTSLGNNYIVNWSNNDRIAVINTETNAIYQYTLVSGSGTSVGKFEPLNSANIAKFDDIKDIKAVYPAMAATVENGVISFSINKEYDETQRAKYGVKSWTPNSSAYAFGNNDIKVSYNTTMTTSGSDAQVNFKFRQLATWCNFVFNFKGTEYELESMESLTITTTDGTKMISGTAQVDLSDPNDPKLKEGTEAAVEWTTTSSLDNAALTKSMMLFPCIDGEQLKITVKTNMNTFTFYATPSTSLKAGTVLRFPIDVNVNFEKDNAATANNFTYQVIPVETDPFYYYGTANCLLLAGKNEDKLDVTPYKTNAFYWNTEDDGSAAPKPTKAKVIWREAGITSMDEPTITEAGGKYTLNISGVQGYGNALVGIYESEATMNADTPLWSYHIWKPEIDPRTELLTYNYTNSGSYEVMPIALGATNKATVTVDGTATNETNAKALGLYYQWGRKDPLGRSANVDNNKAFVMTYAGATGNTVFDWKATENKPNIMDTELLGGEAVEEKDGKKSDVYMIDYVTKHPIQFIVVSDGKYDNDWASKQNDYLWGNPQGYNFPRYSTLHRSIFDPCPTGYRVAPRDLWIGFTDNDDNRSTNTANPSTWPKVFFNILNLSKETATDAGDAGKSTTIETQRGYFFCYQTNNDGSKKWQEGATDFYPAAGYRDRKTGDLLSVGTSGFSWSSSSTNASMHAGTLHFGLAFVSPMANNLGANAFPVRCVKAQ